MALAVGLLPILQESSSALPVKHLAMARPVVLSYFSQSGDSEKDPYLNYLEAEYKSIAKAWERGGIDERSDQYIEVDFPARGSADGNEVAEDIRNYKKRIILFHFSGHAQSESLLFKGGASHAPGIAGHLGEAPNLKLVVLNGCATYDQVNLLFENNIKIVIATKGKVSDGIAREFAGTFYAALSTHDYTIRGAFEHALNELKRKYSNLASRSMMPIIWRGLDTGSEDDRDRWELFYKEGWHGLMEDLNWWQIGERPTPRPKHSVKTIYSDGQAAVPEHFLGREAELAAIGEKFKAGAKVVILRGEGGMGKTTLASKFVEENASHYENKAWVFSKAGIVEDLKNLVNDPTYFQDCVTEEQTVTKLRTALLNMPESTLLVLDNMNNPDDIHYFLRQFRELRWHVLMTSRYGAELKGELPVKPLPDQAAKELFREFYQEESPDFENLLDQVLRAIGYNTLLIEIFAKNMREAHERRQETMAGFLKKFEEQGLYLEKNSFKISTDWLDNVHSDQAGETATIKQILEVLYDFDSLNKNEKERYWLVNMALLPAQSYKVYFLEELWKGTEENICQNYLEPLAKKGWLTFEDYTYRLSPVVQELVLKKNKETLATDAEALLQNLGEILANDGANFINLSFTQAAPFTQLASTITQQLRGCPTYELASLNFNAGIYFENTGDVVRAKQAFEQYGKISAATGNVEAIAISYSKLGGIYEATGDWKNALENYQERNRIGLEIYQSSPENLQYKNGLAISYARLGTFHLNQNEVSESLNHFLQSRTLFGELWEATQGQIVQFTYYFALNSRDVSRIVKWMIQNEHYEEEVIPELSEQIKQMRREGYAALQPLAERGVLHDSQLGLVQALADESWYEF